MSTISLGKESSDGATTSVSRGATIGGWVLGGIPAALLLLDGAFKLSKPAPVVESMQHLGYSPNLAPALGVLLLLCVAVYLLPRTAVLGAILLTGYLGGAVSTHVRVGEGWFAVLFPVFVGAMFWGGLYLRDSRLRALLPLRTK